MSEQQGESTFWNQQKTEQIPPTPAHDVPDTSDRPTRPDGPGDVGAAGPGPRRSTESSSREHPAEAGRGAPGAEPARMRPEIDESAAGVSQEPHDAGRPDSHAAGRAFRVPGHLGESPDPFESDTDEGARRTQESIFSTGTPTPGDPASSPAPSYLAAQGTSEEATPPDGVRITAVAQPGKPDGEYDTRMR